MSKLPLQLRFQSLNYNLINNESEGSDLTWRGKQQPPNLNKNYVFSRLWFTRTVLKRTLKHAES